MDNMDNNNDITKYYKYSLYIIVFLYKKAVSRILKKIFC